jgi:hypothetical protein
LEHRKAQLVSAGLLKFEKVVEVLPWKTPIYPTAPKPKKPRQQTWRVDDPRWFNEPWFKRPTLTMKVEGFIFNMTGDPEHEDQGGKILSIGEVEAVIIEFGHATRIQKIMRDLGVPGSRIKRAIENIKNQDNPRPMA